MEREPLMKIESDNLNQDQESSDDSPVEQPSREPERYSRDASTNWLDTLESHSRKMLNAQSWRNRPLLTGLTVAGFLLVLYAIFTAASSTGRYYYAASNHGRFADMYTTGKAGPATFPLHTSTIAPADLCSICNCDAQPAKYEPSANFSQIPSRPRPQDIWPSSGHIDVNEFMVRTLLDMYCARQHLTAPQALKLLRRSINYIEDMMSWSLSGLELGKPTIYMTTATSPNGKSGPERPQYFRRHGRAIRSWMAQQSKTAEDAGFQVVWIVAEDEVDIDPMVIRTLRRTGVPYVYFAYGLTKSWGNAQKNAVLQIAYALSRPAPRGLYGHGPVYGLDDDNKILPGLLTQLTKVVRAGVFPVGNLGDSGWESPTVDDFGVVTGTDSPWQRKFPLDYGAYAFNSSLLGTLISGPSFWKHTAFGGEEQFVEQIAGNMRDLEPLCGPTTEDQSECHFAWHNEALTEYEKMTDDEEIAYVQKYGAKKLFEKLGFESKEGLE